MSTRKNAFQTDTPASPLDTFKLMLLQLRPKQWSKNVLVFAAIVFSLGTGQHIQISNVIIAFFLFCFVSGCVYILNDFMDREADRQHPEKRHRPMASGQLKPALALSVGAVLLIGSLVTAFSIQPLFALLLAIYFGLNVAYSMKLKHVVILDMMVLASGFVLRAIGGGLVINVRFTPWFLLCVFVLSLFLAIGKRRHELLLLEHSKGSHRKVLESYSEPLLDQMSTIVTTCAIMSYSLFTFMSGRTLYLMWTIPFVFYGIFRYLYLIHVLGKGGKPDELLFEDRGILSCVVLFGVSVAVILTFFN